MEVDLDASDVSINKEDEGNSVTMVDVLKEQEAFEEDAKAVLGASDDKNCTYALGYIKRQALYACITCCPDSVTDSSTRAGICLACSLVCHENHDLVELYTKRNFRCDCGSPKFPDKPCNFNANKSELNSHNSYNQNFAGLYCVCHRPYPDPESNDDDEMIQCIICEDWLHSKHLNSKVPLADQYSEMTCQACMTSNDFLNNYMIYNVKVGDKLNESTASIDMIDANKSTTDPDSVDPTEKDLSSKIVSTDSNEEELIPQTEENNDKKSKLNNTDSSASVKMLDTVESAENENSLEITDVNKAIDTITGVQPNSLDITDVTKAIDINTEVQSNSLDITDVNKTTDINTEVQANSLDITDVTKVIDINTEVHSNSLDKTDITKATDIDTEVQSNSSDITDVTKATDIDTEVQSNSLDITDVTKAIDINTEVQSNSSEFSDVTKAIDINIEVQSNSSDFSDVTKAIDINTEVQSNSSDITDVTKAIDINTEVQSDSTDIALVKTNVDKINEVDGMGSSDEIKIDENTTDGHNTLPKTVEDSEIHSASELDVEKSSLESINITQNTMSIDDEDKEPLDIEMTENKSAAITESGDSSEIDNRIPADSLVENNESETKFETLTESIKPAVETNSIIETPIDSSSNVPTNESNIFSVLSELSETDKSPVINESLSMDVDKNVNLMEIENEKTLIPTVESPKPILEINNSLPVHPENSDSLHDELSNLNKADSQPSTVSEPISVIENNVNSDEKTKFEEDPKTDDTVKASNNIEENCNAVEMDSSSIKTVNVNIDSNKVSEVMEYNSEPPTEEINNSTKLNTDIGNENPTPMESENSVENISKVDTAEITETLLNGKTTDYDSSTNSNEKNKRKSDDDCMADIEILKKKKSDKMDIAEIKCIKPSDDQRIQHHGAVFWPNDWRRKLCSCSSCMDVYHEKKVSFLLDTEDTVTAYEDLGKMKNSSSSQYEKGLEALSSLGHVQQINAITEYNKMKEKLNEFLTKFKNTNKVVKEEDIKSFFAGMKPKREPDGVYFCH